MAGLSSENASLPVPVYVTPVAESGQWIPEDARYDLDGAAKRLGLSKPTTWRLINRGELGHHRLAGRIQVSERQIRIYLKSTERPPIPATEQARLNRYRTQALSQRGRKRKDQS